MGRGAPQSLRDVAKVRPRGRDEKWETLKRRAQLLARLGGPTASLAEGLHVVSIAAVKEPALVVARLRARGVLTVAELAKAATLEQMSVPVTREHLAAAHRDVRALSTAPALAMARDRRRALARYGDIDEAWLTEKRRRIDGLASSLARHEGAPPRTADAWFESVLEIVGIVHGAASRDALAESARRLTALGAEQRRRAVERVEALLTALATGDPLADEHADLAPLVPRLARAAELPGRSRRARVLDVLRSVIAWPEAPAAAVKDLAEPLARRAFDAAVRAAATAIIRALPTDRDRDARDRTLEMLAFYGLAFRSGASDGGEGGGAADKSTPVQLRHRRAPWFEGVCIGWFQRSAAAAASRSRAVRRASSSAPARGKPSGKAERA